MSSCSRRTGCPASRSRTPWSTSAPYGADEVKGNFSEGAWKDVSQGGKVVTRPGGRRADGHDLPHRRLQEVRHHPAHHLGGVRRPPPRRSRTPGAPPSVTSGANVPALFMAAPAAEGCRAVHVRPGQPEGSDREAQRPGVKDVLNYWADLVKRGLVGTQDQFTTDYISGVVERQVRHLRLRRLGSRIPDRCRRGQGPSKGVWAAAPVPQWDTANPVAINWGGSAFAVTTQASEQATGRDRGQRHLRRPEVAGAGLEEADHLPAQQDRPGLGRLHQQQGRPSSAARQANKDVYIPAGKAYKGTVYAPIQVYYYAQLQAQTDQDQRRQDDGRPGGRRPAGPDRQVRQGTGLHGHRVVPVHSA